MKKNKQFEKWANDVLRKVQKVLLLEHFVLLPIKEIDASKEEDTPYSKFHYPYQTIDIRYSSDLLGYWKKGDRKRAVEILTHEMCHPLTDELYSKGYTRFTGKEDFEQAREKLTDHIANIVLKLAPLNLKR